MSKNRVRFDSRFGIVNNPRKYDGKIVAKAQTKSRWNCPKNVTRAMRKSGDKPFCQ